MKVKLFIVALISISLTGCQNKKEKTSETSKKIDSVEVVKNVATDSIKTNVATDRIKTNEIQFSLALSSNALQIINQSNGSTTELGFKIPFEQTIETVEKILKSKPTIGINSECGAGPLKMATWDNGLTLLFQDKNKAGWMFVGWAANQPKNSESKLSTMAGVGVGSTRKEMESAYVIKVSKTSLGYEFSTKSGDLFGIFDGADENAKITNLWSGVSCNFR